MKKVINEGMYIVMKYCFNIQYNFICREYLIEAPIFDT